MARFGKDRCMIMEFIKQFTAMLNEDRNEDYVPKVHGWLVGPTFRYTRQLWREIKAYFPKDWMVGKPLEADKTINTLNGGVIEVMSADDADALVGVGIDICLVTEAARIKDFEQVWVNLEMRLSSPGRGPNGTGGLGLINGTPRGLGYYYDMWKWGQKKLPEYDDQWESWQFASFDNPYLGKKDIKFLESIKKRFPARFYKQEVLGQFLADGNMVFAKFEECATYEGSIEPEPFETYVIGYDIAGMGDDYPAITVRNSKGKGVIIKRLSNSNFSYQWDTVEFYSRWFNNALVRFDATAIGQSTINEFNRRGVPYEGIPISNKNKDEMVNNLVVLTEQHTIEFIKYQPAIEEARDFQYKISYSSRTTSYGNASSNGHDDIITAMFLAYADFDIVDMQTIPFPIIISGVSKHKHKKYTNKDDENEGRKYHKIIVDEETPPKENPDDILRQVCINQGYVPKTCVLPGKIIFGLVNKGEDPCAGCNVDRSICKGRKKKY